MKTQAKQMAEELVKVAHSAELSKQVSDKFKFKIVRFADNKKGMKFDDGSRLLFGNTGILLLPIDDKSTI